MTSSAAPADDSSPDSTDSVQELAPEIYDELRRIAHFQLRRERSGHTLNTTALVHEAYLRLADQSDASWENRTHFMALSARIMRHILIDYARKRNALKRGGDQVRVTFNDEFHGGEARMSQLIALDTALERLAEQDERLARVVELRFFGGLKEQEIGDVLGISARTVRRDWRKARAWLSLALKEDDDATD
jgi:RNA polymerase sigma factor (TIGR02999 family)